MIRKLITFFGTIGILAGGVALIAVMGSMRPKLEKQEAEITPPTVFVATVKTTPVSLDVRAQGEVRPQTDINLTSDVAGRIVATSDSFVNGGAFEKGDVLLQIEDADYRIAVTGTRARVAQAEEALRREEAEADLAEEDYEDLGLGENPSALALRLPQLAQARANYNAAMAELRAAELNLARTKVRAPFKGRVRERIAGPGQYVVPGGQLGRVFSTDIAEIRLPLTDADLAKLGMPLAFTATEENPGPSVKLSTVVAGEYQEWQGVIARTDGAIDPTTRQLSAIAIVEDPYGAGSDDGVALTMGLFVDAEIKGKPFPEAIILPRTALYGRDMVYVVLADDTLESRKVTVIDSDARTVTIAGGVAPGEQVAVSPLRGAGEGDKVMPADNATGSSTPASENVASTAVLDSASTDGGTTE